MEFLLFDILAKVLMLLKISFFLKVNKNRRVNLKSKFCSFLVKIIFEINQLKTKQLNGIIKEAIEGIEE